MMVDPRLAAFVEESEHPSEAVKIGDEVEVKIIEVDRERQRIGLSVRRCFWTMADVERRGQSR